MPSVDLIIVPQGAESQVVHRAVKQCGKKSVDIMTIPLGNNVPSTLAIQSQKLNRANRVVLMGLCGSLSQDYGIGNTVVVNSCQNQFQQQLNFDKELTAQIKERLKVDAVSGLTSDRIINQANHKQELGEQYGTSIVEMEGYYWAELLQRRGISMAMVRVVSDDLGGDIPDLSSAVTSEGNLQALSLTRIMVKQPRAAIKLIIGSLKGLNALKKTTVKLLSS